MIVLPNGLNVYPEDVENALRIAGMRDAVVVETRPGRLEVIILAPGRGVVPGSSREGSGAEPRAGGQHPTAELSPAVRADIGRMIKAANATLGQHQRIDGWRVWPGTDFPRTHTLKIRRSEVQAWALAQR